MKITQEILIRLVVLLLFFAAPAALAQQSFIGNWESRDKSSVVQIYEQELQYYAKVIAGKNPETIGKVVLMQMEKKSDNHLFGGTYHDSELKSEYEARLRLLDNNTIRMKILTGLFSKTIIWHRVKLIWEENSKFFTVTQDH